MSAIYCLLQTLVHVQTVTMHCTLSCNVFGVMRIVQKLCLSDDVVNYSV